MMVISRSVKEISFPLGHKGGAYLKGSRLDLSITSVFFELLVSGSFSRVPF